MRSDYEDFWLLLAPVDFPLDALSKKWRASSEKITRSIGCLARSAEGPIIAIAQLGRV